jgi:exosortase
VAWWQPVVLFALVAWLYSPILFHLAIQWRDDPNFSHGFFVPIFSIAVLWRERSRFLALPLQPSSWGLVVIAGSLLLLILGTLGAELFLARVSLLFLIAGLAVVFFGTNYLRMGLFPWSFLFLMVPIPTIIFNQITFPLQIFASKLAANVLPWIGVPVLREGNIIHLSALSLEVAEACSGIRSLLSLITLAAIYGYITKSRPWIRLALVLGAVPIAILANSFRIVVTGLFVQYWNPSKAEGFFHIFSGWVVFVFSVGMLFLLQRFLRQLRPWMRRGA